jgi:hypothetical protein
MLMGTHNGAIDEMECPVKLAVGIGLLLQISKDAVPDARLPPAVVATGYGAACAISRWEIFPRRTRAQNPHHAVDDATMVQTRPTSVWFLWGEQRFQTRPLLVGQGSSMHHNSLPAVCRYALAYTDHQVQSLTM